MSAEIEVTKASGTVSEGSLAAWLAAQLRVHGDRIKRAMLSQRILRNGGELLPPVMSYDLSGPSDSAELARAIWDDARNDAEDTGGTPSRYVLVLEGESSSVLARKAFRIGGARVTGDVGPEESPTPEGLVALMMRHTEITKLSELKKDDLVFRAYERVIGNLEKEIERAAEERRRLLGQIDKDVERQANAMNLLEALSSRAHERELEFRKQADAHALKNRTLERLEPAIPAILNRLLGRPLAAEDQHASVDALVLSIEPEQVDRLAGVLRPEQKAALHQLYKEAHERVVARDAKAKAAPKSAEPARSNASSSGATETEKGASS